MSSADDESESGEEFTLWDIKDNLDTEPFEVVLKGGRPWGFTITGGIEVRSPIQISEIVEDGKADQSEQLEIGDYLLGVNGIKCVSQTEAVELIEGAFRTLTLTLWRGTSKLESSVKVLRSSSFLQKAREAQERDRNRLGLQDDSIVPKESSTNMKQRPRRIESFHGSRNRRQESTTSVSSSTEASVQSYHTADSKGGTTVHNEKGDNQLPMEQATTPTTKVKEWPTMADLSQQKQILPNKYDGNHGYPNPLLSPSKSSPSLADKEDLVPYSMKTVSYQPPLMNKSSPNIHDDVKISSVHSPSSYSANQKLFSPSAYQKNSHRQYHSSDNFNSVSSQFIKHNSNDYQNLQDIQQSITSNQSHVTNYGLPPPSEKEECEPELQGLTKGDNRPLCSPPAPPTRDISSLKYLPLTSQSHAKYPSWPVTQPSAESESGEPITAPLSVYNEHNANQNNVRSLKDRNSPNSERKASDRNASDPGFKKPIPFSVFLKRPDKKQPQYGSTVETDKKDSESKMNEFFDSQPGYQQPIFDQDGHRIGDEKYNVSPPERESDGRFPSHRNVNKMDTRPTQHLYKGYHDSANFSRDSGINPLLSPDRDSKPPFGDMRYSTSDKPSLHVTPDNKFTDSSTSPMQSPNKESNSGLGSKDNLPDNVHTSIYDPKNSYFVKTMVCYTTGTQTEFNSPKNKMSLSPGYNSHFQFDKSNQAIQTSPENTNREDDFLRRRKLSRDRPEERPKSTSEKDKILLNNINTELDSNDQHSAPFMRKLARDLLANQSQESMNKRRSTSSSGGSGLRSPSSDYSHYFGELKESGSYSSVIIHDDLSEADSTAAMSRQDGAYDSEKQHLHQFENKSKSARRSFDPAMVQKFNRSLQNCRYGSEALLSHSNKDHTSSMINIPRSAREDGRTRPSRPSTDSSSHSHRTGSSTDTFSSTGTHYSFDASPTPYVPSPGQHSKRRESNDSVFSDMEKSPLEKKGDNFKDFKSPIVDKRQKASSWVGRTHSMKKAYGTYDETHSTHKRQESDVSSTSSGGENHQYIHSRSQSDYLPMDALRVKQINEQMLGAINEESSESRWQDALRKSQRASQSSFDQTYTDLDVKKHVNEKLREYQSKTEMEKSNLKRTSSEQFRPMKDRLGNKSHSESKLEEPKQQFPSKQKMLRTNSREKLAQSQIDLPSQSGSDSSSKRDNSRLTSSSSSRTDLQSDSETKNERKLSSPSQSKTELFGSREDIKRVQKNALQNFMLTKTGRLPSDEDEQEQSPDNGQPQPQTTPDRSTRISVTESFRIKYAEGDKLRRSRSISSTDSGNYTEMRPPVRPQQTEWSRVRSQTTRRPLSVGSDSGASLVDPYAVTPITSSFDHQCTPSFDHQRTPSFDHQRKPSDTTENPLQSPRTEQISRDIQKPQSPTDNPQSPRMGSSNIYQNLMQEHTGYRKPPPPPPPTDEDKPPELPPRNYRGKETSQSDSQLLPPKQQQHHYQQPQEESHENYVEQLRKFSRRYSEQQTAVPMAYLSSKTQTHITQSYPKPEVKSLEATSPMTTNSPPSSISPGSPKMSMSLPFLSQQQPSYAASFTQPTSQTKNISPKSSHQHSPSSSSFEVNNEKQNESRHQQPSPCQSPPPRHPQPSPRQSPPPSLHHQISSPEPPPPPTPMKEGAEFDQELPPPPPEIMEDIEHIKERFSDDSYLAHKSKGDTRQIGTYKRSSTTGDVNQLSSETNNNKDREKPPRKRLQQAWQPPTSKSDNSNSEPDTELGPVPRFSAREVQVNPTVVKSVAKPLDKSLLQQRPLGNSVSASALLTPQPFSTSSADKSQKDNHSHSAERPSVRDLKSCYENKSTPTRKSDRFTSPKLIPRIPSNINKSRSNIEQRDLPNGFDSSRRFSHENSQQSETQNSFNESLEGGPSRLSLESDSSKFSSPRQTSFPPERHKLNNHGHNQDRTKKISYPDLNGDVQSPLLSQDNHKHDSYVSNNSGVQSYRHPRSSEHDSNHLSKSHKSFMSNHEQYPENRKCSADSDHISPYSARDQDITTQSCHVRQRSQEELDCDEKVSELVKKDESLKQVLQVDNKGRMDFMNGLFPLEEPIRHHHSPQSSSVNDQHQTEKERKEEHKSSTDPSALPADYFKSSPKAKIEMDMRIKSDELNQEFSKEIQDSDSLIRTKEELVKSIQKKVDKLKDEKAEFQKELEDIDDVGKRLLEIVQKKCRTQQEKDKFSSYVTDMEKIIKLLLKLSGLLARAENALQSLPENSSPSVKKLAVDKRDRLQNQHEEAKSLKEDIDKRSIQVSTFLQDCLSDTEYDDYQYFVQMKSKLTIEMQEFEDKITLGQEQILGLKRNIPGK